MTWKNERSGCKTIMKTKLIIGASVGLVCYRAYLVVSQLSTDSVGGWALGISGALTIVTTAWAWRVGKPDVSWRGVGVGLLYLMILLLRPARSEGGVQEMVLP